jgi:hypothetical protein
MQDLTKAQEYEKTKAFLYHHAFNSKDEANGWKNFVSAKSSNFKAPPPGNQKVKKVIVVEDSSSDSDGSQKSSSKKPRRHKKQKNSTYQQRWRRLLFTL